MNSPIDTTVAWNRLGELLHLLVISWLINTIESIQVAGLLVFKGDLVSGFSEHGLVLGLGHLVLLLLSLGVSW